MIAIILIVEILLKNQEIVKHAGNLIQQLKALGKNIAQYNVAINKKLKMELHHLQQFELI
jgi:hypothetical protein